MIESLLEKRRRAGRMGGIARNKIYGNPGTPESRRRGGLNSIATHKSRNTKFKTLKLLPKISRSNKLAEMLGILMGDGHLSSYQILVVTNSETDREHAFFVKRLFEEITGLIPTLKFHTDQNAVSLLLSSKALVGFLSKLGMPIGNKIKKGLSIPEWVLKNRKYSISFLRGLFDTDGSFYIDKHIIKGKLYQNPCLSITSASPKFILDIFSIMTSLGFRPTKTSKNSVLLRREVEIRRFFSEVGSSNPKHLERFKKFSTL